MVQSLDAPEHLPDKKPNGSCWGCRHTLSMKSNRRPPLAPSNRDGYRAEITDRSLGGSVTGVKVIHVLTVQTK